MVAGFPENNFEDDDDEFIYEDEIEYSRTQRWEPMEDDVESMIDYSDDDGD